MVMPSHRRIACSICVSVDDVMMWAWWGAQGAQEAMGSHGDFPMKTMEVPPVPYFSPPKKKTSIETYWGQVVLVWNPSSEGVDTFDQYPVLKDSQVRTSAHTQFGDLDKSSQKASKLQKRMEKVQTRWCSPGYVCWNTNHSDYRYIYHNWHLVYIEIGMGLVLDIPIYHNP